MNATATPARRRRPYLPQLVTTGVVDDDALGQRGVFLRPGDWVFGRGTMRVSTLLGSCVALVLWSPRLRAGAACHCLLPQRPGGGTALLDGRYGSDAARWMEQRFADAGCSAGELQASLAGGASSGNAGIGPANIAWAQQWAAERGIAFAQQDVGGRVVRRVTFNLADGSLTVAHGGRLAAGEN
ncbi:MAG: chemotaxis protein CheD [Rubrivivax sp.]